MTGHLALCPLEVLLRMSPMAFIQSLIYAYLTGELSSFPTSPNSLPSTYLATLPIAFPSQKMILALSVNGLLAFLLNISSFSTNKAAGVLTMTVCDNIKQCLTILLGIAIFGIRVEWMNGVGTVGALAGATWYSVVELEARMK
jgi:hypothetical protein